MYDADDVVLVFDDSSSLTNRYLHGNLIDQIFADETATEVLWALTDNQGTVRDVANYDPTLDTSSVLNHRKFDAYGNITAESNPNVDFLFAWTGRYFDVDTGLQLNGVRWYDARTGRWMSIDPIHPRPDTNGYRYTWNSPTNFTDPSGMDPPLPEDAPKLAVSPAPGFATFYVSDELQEGETVPKDYKDVGPTGIPKQLKGKWKVSVVSYGFHSWIRYENVGDPKKVHTAGRYATGYGGRVDENGNQVIPPAKWSGIHWDRDLKGEPGFKSGRFASRSIIVTDPVIFTGGGLTGFDDRRNNCATYAGCAWESYSGESLRTQWGWIGPDHPDVLEQSIRKKNKPLPPYIPAPGAFNTTPGYRGNPASEPGEYILPGGATGGYIRERNGRIIYN